MLNQPRHTKQKRADTLVETAESHKVALDLLERVVILESGSALLAAVNEGIVHQIQRRI